MRFDTPPLPGVATGFKLAWRDTSIEEGSNKKKTIYSKVVIINTQGRSWLNRAVATLYRVVNQP
jgi:hypothetical protein